MTLVNRLSLDKFLFKKSIALKRLHGEILHCQRCHLSENRSKAVPGEGVISTHIMFIGEAPGREEDKQGRPFVGRAGKFLDELLEEAGFQRDKVYIGNVLKCRPSIDGRDRRPSEEEIKACSPYLDRQIELIQPRVICTLGNVAMEHIFRKYGLDVRSISRIHGSIFKKDNLQIIPLYHPAAVLYKPNLESIMRRDFKIIKKMIHKD